jgi:hypothetical protein
VEDTFRSFDPLGYLRTYYPADVGAENDEYLGFLARAYAGIRGARLLDVGCGPTIYQLISACTSVDEIHLRDPSAACLEQVRRWLRAEPASYPWGAYIARALEHEHTSADDAAVDRRATRLRKKVASVREEGVEDLPAIAPGRYDVVSMHFVAESITSDREQWRATVRDVAALVGPGGHLVLGSIGGATRWRSGDRTYPAVPVTLPDIEHELESHGLTPTFDVRVPALADAEYESLIGVVATRESTVGA